MSVHQGQTTTLLVKGGMTFCVKSGALKSGDHVHLRNMDGTTFDMVIAHQALNTLELKFGDLTLVCRPWSRGDHAMARPYGTASNWTVSRLVETEPA